MTWFINFRSAPVRGVVVDGSFGQTAPGDLAATRLLHLDERDVLRETDGQRILFVSHGFNVPQASGIAAAVHLEDDLRKKTAPFPLDATTRFVGVLWPGDWYNVLNFPTEARDAEDAGRRLGRMIDDHFRNAASVSFASHSLGARLILTAAETTTKKVAQIILTAPAADNDCLVRQYPAAVRKADATCVLHSKRDRTLKYVYGVGDAITDFLGDDDSPFNAALGYRGPKPKDIKKVAAFGIAGKPHGKKQMLSDFDHCHYFPAADDDRTKRTKSHAVSNYISAAFAGQSAYWRL